MDNIHGDMGSDQVPSITKEGLWKIGLTYWYSISAILVRS